MITARLQDAQGQSPCAVVFDDGRIQIEDTDDRILMVKMHVYFRGTQHQEMRDENGVLQLVELKVGTELHFLTALRRLESTDYAIEIVDSADSERR